MGIRGSSVPDAPAPGVAPGARPPSSRDRPAGARKRRWPAVVAAIVVLFAGLILVFDWNWLREPINAYVTRKTQREFSSSDLHVRLGMNPTIRLRGVVFDLGSPAPWAVAP